eukprot:TCONS_00016331-protein
MIIDVEEILDLSFINPNNIFEQLQDTGDFYIHQRAVNAWNLLSREKDYDNACAQSQVLLDKTWEHLNTGYWKDVKLVWRHLYTLASLMKTCSLYCLSDTQSALKACDMGLLMGAPIFDNVLGKLASKLSEILRKKKDVDDVVEPVSKKIKGCIEYGRANYLPTDDVSKIENRIQEKFSIPKIDNISLIEFQENYLKTETPVIIQNAMNHWPAMEGPRKWGIDYLRTVAGSRTVPVEIGDKYTSDNWTQTLMSVNDFIDKYIANRTNTGYLAQHQLFDQVPELKNDILPPDYCYLSDSEAERPILMHAWFGPTGTVSPLHHDPYQNILAQVMGSKYIRLYSRDSPHMYANVDSILDNTSQVDLENIDQERFPDFHRNVYHECLLNEGEMLFIPFKSWHFVKSLSTSFSVSFWWK